MRSKAIPQVKKAIRKESGKSVVGMRGKRKAMEIGMKMEERITGVMLRMRGTRAAKEKRIITVMRRRSSSLLKGTGAVPPAKTITLLAAGFRIGVDFGGMRRSGSVIGGAANAATIITLSGRSVTVADLRSEGFLGLCWCFGRVYGRESYN